MFMLDCQTHSTVWSALAASFAKQTLMKSTVVLQETAGMVGLAMTECCDFVSLSIDICVLVSTIVWYQYTGTCIWGQLAQ